LDDVRTSFIGPFDTVREAEFFLTLPTNQVFADSFCDGKHEIRNIITPDYTQMFTVSQVREVLDRAKERTILEIARETKPFVMENEEVQAKNPRRNLYENRRIVTIKTLRNRYPGLGLKEAKEIVDGWRYEFPE
jgi:ribosomal protein L7/L12